MRNSLCVLILCVALPGAKQSMAEVSVADVECVAYWQLKSIALLQDHSIASVKAAENFQQQYVKAKNAHIERYGAEAFTGKFYEALQRMMPRMDNDLAKVAVLDTDYANRCYLQEQKGLND